MPMEKVLRKQAIAKSEFHRRLREWFNSTNEPTIANGQGTHVAIKDGDKEYRIDADTKRESVREYLAFVDREGDSIQWTPVLSARGKMTKIAVGKGKVKIKSLQLYLVEPSDKQKDDLDSKGFSGTMANKTSPGSIDELCAGWSVSGRRIIESIWQELLPGDAYAEPKDIRKHFRVYLTENSTLVAQLTDRPQEQAVLVKLSVGDGSPFIGEGKPLSRSKSGTNPSERARGEAKISAANLSDLRRYLAAAFYYCRTGKIAQDTQPGKTVSQFVNDEPEVTDDGLDHRQVVTRQLKARRGQKPFRDALIRRFENKCAVTGCPIEDVLEAAHIKPYRAGERDNHEGNGLLLRADIHTLFDLDMIGINPDSLLIELHPSLVGTKDYGWLNGLPLATEKSKPMDSALRIRYKQFQACCGQF